MSTEKNELRQEYLNHVRVLEYAERQTVSLLEIKGITKDVLQALWKLGLPTADAVMDADVDLVVAGLRSCDIPISRDDDRAARVVTHWRRQIRRLVDDRAGSWPVPQPWEDEA